MDSEKIIHDINILNKLIHEEIVDEHMLPDTIDCFESSGALLISKGFSVEEAFDLLTDLFDAMVDEYEDDVEEDG